MRHPPKFDPLILAGVLSAFVTGSACAHESRIVPALLKGGKVESPPQSRVRLSVGFTQEPTLEDQWNSIDLILFSYKDSCQNLGADAPNDFVGNPIDPTLTAGGSPGDAVNLTVSALYLAYDQPWLKPGQTTLNGDMSGPFKIGSKPFEPPFDKDAHGNPINNSILSEVVIGKVNFDSTKSTVAPVSQSNLYESTDSFFPTFHTWFKPTHPGNPDKGGAYGFRITGTVSYGASSYDCQGKLKHPHDAQIPAGTVEVDEYFVCRGGTQAPPEEMSCVMQQVTFPGTQQDGYSANAPLSGAGVVKVSPKYVPVWH